MGDRITLRNVRAYGKHGADPRERDPAQPLDLDLELALDLSRARASDSLADTLDYAALHTLVTRIVAELSYQLLERLGEELLVEIMRDPRVSAARVTIAKPKLLAGATPAVSVQRTRT